MLISVSRRLVKPDKIEVEGHSGVLPQEGISNEEACASLCNELVEVEMAEPIKEVNRLLGANPLGSMGSDLPSAAHDGTPRSFMEGHECDPEHRNVRQ